MNIFSDTFDLMYNITHIDDKEFNKYIKKRNISCK